MKSIQKFKLFTVFHTIFALLAILSYGLRVEAFSYTIDAPRTVGLIVSSDVQKIQYVTAIDSSGVFVEKRFVAKATALDSCNTPAEGRAVYIPRLQNTFSLGQNLNCFSLSLNVGSFSDQETIAVSNLTNSSVEHIFVFKETPKIEQFGFVRADDEHQTFTIPQNRAGSEMYEVSNRGLGISYIFGSSDQRIQRSVFSVGNNLFEVLRC
ncbi:MAG: hypothetical protein ACYC5G_02945 [Candidatus Doudnabacteria bacterium]